MEDLKINNETNEQNISVEDLLDAQSLLIMSSDTESDADKSPWKQNCRKAMLRQELVTENNENNEQPILMLNKRKKNARLVDTESEEEVATTTSQIKLMNINKISALIDTESEDEKVNYTNEKIHKLNDNENSDKEAAVKLHKKRKNPLLIDSENSSDDDDNRKAAEAHDKEHMKKSKENKNNKNKIENVNKFSTLADSESEHSSAGGDEQNAATAETKEKDIKSKTVRASAKKTMDEMQAIQSEQQRLHREAHISVPYHQPKKRTLQEFLSRRTINKPTDSLCAAADRPKSKNLKMTQEELEEYAKLMEERAKEAAEFFKSESESEEETVQKTAATDNTNIINTEMTDVVEQEMHLQNDVLVFDKEMEIEDNPSALDQTPEKTHIIEVLESASETKTKSELLVLDTDTVQNNAKELIKATTTQAEIVEALPATSNNRAIITEVLELPKLDLSALNITVQLAQLPEPEPTEPPPQIKSKINSELKRLILEKSANISPAIKGDSNMIIDLETGDMYAKKPTPVESLLQRLMKSRGVRKIKENKTISILSTENSKVEIKKMCLNNSNTTETKSNNEYKPGEAYQKLKQGLKMMIDKKRLEYLQKKKADEQEHIICLGDEDDNELADTGNIEYKPANKLSKKMVIDDEENTIYIDENEDFVDDEEQNEDEDANTDTDEEEVECDNEKVETDDGQGKESHDDDSSEEQSDNEQEDENMGNKSKNRIVRAFENDTDSNEDDDNGCKAKSTVPILASKLFEDEEKRTISDEENELLNLCSGKFTDSQTVSAENANENAMIISQIPNTQLATDDSKANDELLELCSGTFETQTRTNVKNERHGNKILSTSGDDEETDEIELNRQRKKKLSKKMKKKKEKQKLGFSDDENSVEAKVSTNNVVNEDEEDHAGVENNDDDNDVPETFVEYDSEENEIIIKMNKKERVLHAANFVEDEAELSESDWGSADEDENNMDKYDIELADEDEFDREKLQTELARIHARKMLDQDIREVRKLQELFFEDEENDGVGRQRQFKWKNVETDFSLYENKNNEYIEAQGESGDEENEHMWRKIRFEREQLLLKSDVGKDGNPVDMVASPLITTQNNVNSRSTTTQQMAIPSTIGNNNLRKLNIITNQKNTVETTKISSPFLIQKKDNVLQRKPARGSFLVRDKATLTKLAGLTKGLGADADGTAGPVSLKIANTKNFVFATLTEEEHENQKRKADELLNSSSEMGINYMKKPRLEPRRNKCFIDQLL